MLTPESPIIVDRYLIGFLRLESELVSICKRRRGVGYGLFSQLTRYSLDLYIARLNLLDGGGNYQ
jgi:hypothetical protein